MYYYQRRLLEEAAKYASKETEITEVWWKGDGPLSKQEADSLLDDLESAYKKGGLNGTMQIPNGDSGPVWEMLSGLKQFLRGEPKNTIAHIIAGVKKFLKPGDLNSPKLKGLFESLDESADPLTEAKTVEFSIMSKDYDGMEAAYQALPKRLANMMLGSGFNMASKMRDHGFECKNESDMQAIVAIYKKTLGGSKVTVKKHTDKLPNIQTESVEESVEVNEYYRRSGFRSSSYSGDPRWITAKYAGTDAKGRPFKKGEEVLYYPNGKKIYSGPEAEKMWREFQSAKGDEMGMPYAS